MTRPDPAAPLVLAHDRDVTPAEVLAVAAGRAVALHESTARLLDARRREIVDHVTARDAPAYGFNTGFGHNVRLRVGPGGDDRRRLQTNLIRSHACGVGEPAPEAIVRATMLLRARSLARGHSGVRAVVVQRLIDLLNAGITPEVPRLGSVSASGDLAPLSHVALALLGEGRVTWRGQVVPAGEALGACGLAPLELDLKEGLALNNGVQYANAIGLVCLDRMDALLRAAALATALSAQVMLGADTPFRDDLHRLRPHPGARRVAGWIFALMRASPIRESHRAHDHDDQVQDPYNLRCAAQVLGACADLLERARATLAIEANSVTDNPVLLPDAAGAHVEIVSGGNFHGTPVAVDLYGLLQAMGLMARLSNMRCARFVDEARNRGLGADLKWPGPTEDPEARAAQALRSAMMMPEYASAGLTNWIWGAAMPIHLFSLSTDAGQEDHVSMAANVGLRVLDHLPRLAEVLAIELAYCAQAAAIRKATDFVPSDGGRARRPWAPHERRLNPVGEAVLARVARDFPPLQEDRPLADELAALAATVLRGDLLAVVAGHGVALD